MTETTPKTVLLVEDDIVLARLLMDIIKGFGMEVRIAHSAKQAEGIVHDAEPFDLVLADVSLPEGENGFRLAARIRQVRSDVPVLYMSGRTDYTAAEMGAVVAPVLLKPVAPDALHAALMNVIA